MTEKGKSTEVEARLVAATVAQAETQRQGVCAGGVAEILQLAVLPEMEG